jgi:diacylglycerol kinase family enzyme
MSTTPQWPALEEAVTRIAESGTLFAGAPLSVTVVVNPFAGCFSTERRARHTIDLLCESADQLAPQPPGSGGRVAVTIQYTHYVGHAHELVLERLQKVSGTRHLGVSAGGDGTHGEVMSAYLEWKAAGGHGNAVMVRLPLGTGNDGAESRDLAAALGAIAGFGRIENAPHLTVEAKGMHLLRGFNIASIGLDAYIAAVTNRLKRMFRGDLYKVVADVATLFYEQIVGVSEMQLVVSRAGAVVDRLKGLFMLSAIGASGHREYGGGKRVLPGDENLCAIERVGLFGKIKLKSLFYKALHVNEPTVYMRLGDSFEIHYDRRVPMQIDGESVWLRAENFPVAIRTHPPEIPVLHPI